MKEEELKNYNILLEINSEKKIFSISNQDSKTNQGITKRFYNKGDIIRLFTRYLYKNVDIPTIKYERNRYYGRRNYQKKNYRKRQY